MEIMNIYTNNNNIRHFFSMYEIMAKDLFETDKYYDSLSTIHPKCIFLTHRELSSGILNNFLDEKQNCYPVIIKINIKFLKKIGCYLITNDYRCCKGTIEEYNENEHLGVFVPFFIPLFTIDSIWFKTDEEKSRFLNARFDNVCFEYYNFDVDDVLFNGSLDLDIEKLKECFSDISSLIIDDEKIRIRRKIKAGLVSAFGNFKIALNNDISVSFDKVFFRLFHYLFKNKYNIDKDLSSFKKQCKLDLSQINDVTSFSIVLDQLLEQPDEVLPLSDNKEKNIIYKFDNLFIYYYILIKIIKTNNSDFYDLDIEDVLAKMDSELNNDDSYNELKNFYRDFFKKIKEIKTSAISITDVIKNLNNNYPGLKSLIFVLSMDKGSKILDLYNKLEKYKVDQFIRRLSLFTYGMIVGVAPINSAFKSFHTVMALSDLVSLKNYYTDFYEKFNYDEIKEILKNANSSDFKKETKDKAFLNYYGIKLPIYKVDYSNKLRLELLELLKDNQKEEKLKKIMPEIIESFRQHCDVEQCFYANTFIQQIENGKVKQRFKKKPDYEYVWREEKWEYVKNNIIKNEENFKKLKEAELTKLGEKLRNLK